MQTLSPHFTIVLLHPRKGGWGFACKWGTYSHISGSHRDWLFSTWQPVPNLVVWPLNKTLWKSLECNEAHSCFHVSGSNQRKMFYSSDPVCVCVSPSLDLGQGSVSLNSQDSTACTCKVTMTWQEGPIMERGRLHFFSHFYKHFPSLFTPAQQLDLGFKMNNPAVLVDQRDTGHC